MPTKNDLSIWQVQTAIVDALSRLPVRHAPETVVLHEALGRVLAADVISPMSIPVHTHAAMDGYALCGASAKTITSLRIVGSASAGHPYGHHVQRDEAVWIMTGAVMPSGTDTVIPQEQAVINAQYNQQDTLDPSHSELRPGMHCRIAGEDLRQGQVALPKGRVLTPVDLGLAASLGQPSVWVQKRLRVAILSTGDELRTLETSLLDTGGIYDANRVTLRAMLEKLGCEVVDAGIIKDQPDVLDHHLRHLADLGNVDVILTSGGVATGDADVTRQVMQGFEGVTFCNIAMRPGRPFAFGVFQSAQPVIYFGLPGNPVAAIVSFCFLVRPALLRRMAAEVSEIVTYAVSATPLQKRLGRTEYRRGICSHREGVVIVEALDNQSSASLYSMTKANCLMVLDAHQEKVAMGERVNVVMFNGLM